MDECPEFLWLDVLGVRVGAGCDEAEDRFGEGNGEQAGERGAGDGGEDQVAAGLKELVSAVRGIEVEGVKGRRGITLTMSPRDLRNSPGSSTCSITSIAHTTSNVSPSSRSASAEVWRYSSDPGIPGLEADADNAEPADSRIDPDDDASASGGVWSMGWRKGRKRSWVA